MKMIVRKSTSCDLVRILEIYESARNFMRNNGNPEQWSVNYPPVDIVKADIESGISFVCELAGEICAVFVLAFGDDPLYRVIQDGQWLNDLPFASVHRVASDMTVRGITKSIFDYCKIKSDNIKCDTHRDNIPMQRALEKNGFLPVGTVYAEDGTPRIAYHYVKN